MQIYHASVSLEEGYAILEQPTKHDRLVRGKRVDRPSGWALFHHMKGQPIRCHFCGCQADQWVAEKGRKDKLGHPTLNLFATSREGGVVIMTRDHIIPKSLGGVDAVENLRPACGPCNEQRSNDVSPEVIEFARCHPELIDEGRIKRGLESLQAHIKSLSRDDKQNAGEIERLKQPFKDMGYL